MPLDEHGVPERRLDPDLGRENEPAGQTDRNANRVWVKAELQEAAQQFSLSWGRSHAEMVAEHDLQFVTLKFKDSGTKNKFVTALRPFVDRYRQHHSTGVGLDGGANDGVNMSVRIELFHPDVFSEIVHDLAKTELDTVTIIPEIHDLAALYVKAFAFQVVRVDLSAGEDADEGIIESLEKTLTASQKRLMGFLELLLKSLPSKDAHRVVIHDVDQIEVDGGELKNIKNAAKRALLALALLRMKPTFKTEDFVRYYNGEKTPAEPRHDFDNAMKALRGILPKIAIETGGGNRTVKNVQFRVKVSDKEIEEHLKYLY